LLATLRQPRECGEASRDVWGLTVNDQNDSAEQLTNVSTDLTALADAKARVRIDTTERDTDTVGFVLGQYRSRAGLTERELAAWLGIDLPVLADLAEEIRPEKRRILAGYSEIGLDQLAEVYGADRAQLLEAFDRG
jgi:hypothetical protein